MNKKEHSEKLDVSNDLTVPAFGYELIREELLNDLLGKDRGTILYWAGKRLARTYPLFSFNEIKEFFHNAGWGSIELIKENKNEYEFELTSKLIEERLKRTTNITFQMEAGFLAEQIQLQKKVYAEAYENLKKKEGKVCIIVKWETVPYDR